MIEGRIVVFFLLYTALRGVGREIHNVMACHLLGNCWVESTRYFSTQDIVIDQHHLVYTVLD